MSVSMSLMQGGGAGTTGGGGTTGPGAHPGQAVLAAAAAAAAAAATQPTPTYYHPAAPAPPPPPPPAQDPVQPDRPIGYGAFGVVCRHICDQLNFTLAVLSASSKTSNGTKRKQLFFTSVGYYYVPV
ncbi:hypothetical protein HZH68_011970 [Vespula germanica]|uniref:Uncharacterized protein n=2 Tax=Vespula TaxID=7451 RepID=A0A834JKB4_VESGE|nr:hypothetical protein HZH68_011970 [Vespula germanica]KAF7413086.1 hypothetical protein H0235_012937 [Vespula pensylvanica]